MAGFLHLSERAMKEVAPDAGGDSSNWKSVDVHLQKQRCRPKAFPQRSGPPKEIKHLMSQDEYVFYLNTANRILRQDLLICRVVLAIIFCMGILGAVAAGIIISHYMRWNYISSCSLSLPAGDSCDRLPAMNLFDSKAPAFSDCYSCTRYKDCFFTGSSCIPSTNKSTCLDGGHGQARASEIQILRKQENEACEAQRQKTQTEMLVIFVIMILISVALIFIGGCIFYCKETCKARRLRAFLKRSNTKISSRGMLFTILMSPHSRTIDGITIQWDASRKRYPHHVTRFTSHGTYVKPDKKKVFQLL